MLVQFSVNCLLMPDYPMTRIGPLQLMSTTCCIAWSFCPRLSPFIFPCVYERTRLPLPCYLPLWEKKNSHPQPSLLLMKSSPGSHSQSASSSVSITSSCSLLVFLLSVSLMSLHLCCLCYLELVTFVRLLIVATLSIRLNCRIQMWKT